MRRNKEIPSFVYDPNCVLYVPLWRRDAKNADSFTSDDACGQKCTVTGAAWGLYGRTFNGTSDLISVTQTSSLDCAGGGITIIVWAKPTAIAAVDRLVDKEGGASTGYLLGFDANRTVWVRMNSDAVNPLVTTASVPLSTWTHIVGWWDGVTIKAYLNGVVDVTTVAKSGTINADPANLILGRWVGGGAGYYNGTMGEVRIYNRPLQSREIAEDYEETKWRYQ